MCCLAAKSKFETKNNIGLPLHADDMDTEINIDFEI